MSKNSTPTNVGVDGPPVATTAVGAETARPGVFWDRIKFVILLLGSCGLAGSPSCGPPPSTPLGGPFSDALRIAFARLRWILVLLALEVLRQLHYLIEEHSKAYYALLAEEGLRRGLAPG